MVHLDFYLKSFESEESYFMKLENKIKQDYYTDPASMSRKDDYRVNSISPHPERRGTGERRVSFYFLVFFSDILRSERVKSVFCSILVLNKQSESIELSHMYPLRGLDSEDRQKKIKKELDGGGMLHKIIECWFIRNTLRIWRHFSHLLAVRSARTEFGYFLNEQV